MRDNFILYIKVIYNPFKKKYGLSQCISFTNTPFPNAVATCVDLHLYKPTLIIS